MIIYGSRGTHHATVPLPHVACPACGRAGTLQAAFISRYAHIYWVPLFPYRRVAVVQCQACGHEWADGEQVPAFAAAVAEAKGQARSPLWMWSGLALLLLGIAWAAIANNRDTKADDTSLLSPQAGDVYSVRDDSSGHYSLLKVRRADGNMVELVSSQYETEDATPYTQLKDSAYSDEPYELTRLDLQIMRRKGQITDVDHP